MKKYLVIYDVVVVAERVIEIVEAESVEKADSIAWEKSRKTGFSEGNYELLEIKAGKLYRDGKKLSKKEVYAFFGIEYNGSQILSPYGWLPTLLVDGNNKVGKAAKTWSIMHGNETYTADSFTHPALKEVFEMVGCDSVKGSCPCHCDACYCDAGQYKARPTAYRSNLIKLFLSRGHLDFVRRAIIAQIFADGISQCRIHAAGDFFSAEYVQAWREIIGTCEECRFWTYTKEKEAVNAFKDLKNVHVVPSITPYGFNFGTCAQLLEMHRKLSRDGYKVHVCACGTPYEKHCCDCETGCKYVGEKCDFVLFIKHSCSDYKAGEKDPEEYERVLEIVRSQDN